MSASGKSQTISFLSCAVCIALSLIGTVDEVIATQPELSLLQPVGFQRGTEVTVTLTGRRLEDAQELLIYSPGIEVKSFQAESATQSVAVLAIAPDCPLGIHALRLRSATGISGLRTFTVGALSDIKEVEPNSNFSEPQPVEMDRTVLGRIDNEDIDYYVIEAAKGDRITAEIEGMRLGYTFFDPYVAILNEQRFEVARSDDAPLAMQDAVCSMIAPEDGRYIIEVRESAFGGNGNCWYRLHVGHFPRPRTLFPGGGRPGETVDVHWIGGPEGEWSQQVTIPDDAVDEFQFYASDDQGIAPAPYTLRVADLTSATESEPNNDRNSATQFTAPAALHGIISEPNDRDFFRFQATKDQKFRIRVYARSPFRSLLDAVLVVRKEDGTNIGSNDDNEGHPDSMFDFTAPEDGLYTIDVRDHLRSGGPEFVYRIEVTPLRPTTTMILPERRRYVSTTLMVPQGNRMALMVDARRRNWGGELDVSFEGLPEGLSFETVTMPNNRSTVPVLFTASSEAAVSGSLVDVIGRPADGREQGEGHLNQRQILARIMNRDMWGHSADRMATAVINKVPFRIEIVQPQVPIVRNGMMDLKVVVIRDEGFDAEVPIRMLYNPPGIGSSRSIKIPAGQTEATIPMTANGNAAIGSWPIVVTATGPLGNSTVETASQMAQLEIADRFFNLTFQRAAVQQGQQTQMVIQIAPVAPLEGSAQATLMGLPSGVTAEPIELTSDMEQMVFTITAAADARIGKHTSIFCRTVLMRNSEPITLTLGSGELRIDRPPAEPMQQAATPPPIQTQPEEPRQLTRLEQLRQQRQQTQPQEE